MNSSMSMFEPSERAIDLYKRIKGDKLSVSFGLNPDRSLRTETFQIGDFIEVQTASGYVSYAVLDMILQFAEAYHDKNGLIIHISTGNILQTSLKICKESMSEKLQKMNDQGFVKSITVQNIVQLISILTILANTLVNEKCLIVFDGLNHLLLSQKGFNDTLPTTSLIQELLQRITYLKALWYNTANIRDKGGLREGPSRDPLSQLWRSKVSKQLLYVAFD